MTTGEFLTDPPTPQAALTEIHRIAEWHTFRGHCSDECRTAWAEVCRLARDAGGGQ